MKKERENHQHGLELAETMNFRSVFEVCLELLPRSFSNHSTQMTAQSQNSRPKQEHCKEQRLVISWSWHGKKSSSAVLLSLFGCFRDACSRGSCQRFGK